MTSSNGVPKGYAPVLVCLASEPLSLSCALRVLYDKSRQQMTLTLRVAITLDGFEAEQIFIMQYDADEIIPTLHNTTIPVPQAWLDNIARNTDPWIRTLLLRLKKPCQLWCPRLDRLAPKAEPSSVASFNTLMQLAKATEVHIVFDYNRLHTDVRKSVVGLAKGTLKLTGHPCERLLKHWRRADSTIFDNVEAAPPPTYAEASNKRTRPGSSSTSSSPPSKRRTLSQAEPLSPTEPATSSPPADETSPKKHPNDDHEFQTRAISQVVERHLPAALREVLPEILLDLLPNLFALPSSFSSFPDDSDSSQTLQPPSKLTLFGAAFVPRLVEHLQPQLQKMLRKAASYEEDRRQETALEFEEQVEDYKADMNLIKEDGVEALQKEVGYTLDEVRHDGNEYIEELNEDVTTVLFRGADIIEDATHEMITIKEGFVEDIKTTKEKTLKDTKYVMEFLSAATIVRHAEVSRIPDWRHRKWARGRWRRGGKGGYRGLVGGDAYPQEKKIERLASEDRR